MQGIPERVDVLVIGGGFAGAATAYALTRAGVTDVLICERESTCGHHASGRNAAMCRQLTESDRFTDLTCAGAAFLRDPPAGFTDVPLLRRTGSVLLADDTGAIDAMLARAAARGLPCERIDLRALTRRWPQLRGAPAAGGVFFPTDGVIDVHALLQGFLAGARDAGARLWLGCEVLGIADRGRGALVRTTRGEVEVSRVVIAAGAWVEPVGALAGASPPRYRPIQRHLFLTDAIADLDRDAPFVWHVGAREFYVRPEGSGLLISGCDETEMEPYDARVAPGAVEELAAKLSIVAPGLADRAIARAWACLRTFAPGGSPIIDWDPDLPWLFWVAGLGGHGATASAAIGAEAARKLTAR